MCQPGQNAVTSSRLCGVVFGGGIAATIQNNAMSTLCGNIDIMNDFIKHGDYRYLYFLQIAPHLSLLALSPMLLLKLPTLSLMLEPVGCALNTLKFLVHDFN